MITLKSRLKKFNKNKSVIRELEKILFITNLFGFNMNKKIKQINDNFELILSIVKEAEFKDLFYLVHMYPFLNEIFYTHKDVIAKKIKEIKDPYYVSSYLYIMNSLNLDFDKKKIIFNLFFDEYSKLIQEEIMKKGLFNLTEEEKEEFCKFLDRYYEQNKEKVVKDLILKILLTVDVVNFKKNESKIDETYVKFFVTVIDELLEEQNKKYSEIISLGMGNYSEALKIGDKILKIGKTRETIDIPNSEYILQPLIRFNLLDNNQNDCMSVEITEEVELNNITDEDVYNIYKNLRNQGIIWNDPKVANVGRLKKKNITYLKGMEIKINQEQNGFLRNNIKTLEKGSCVILDSDYLYLEENFNKINDMSIYKYEKKYCLEMFDEEERGR